jgi:hypothetical protein
MITPTLPPLPVDNLETLSAMIRLFADAGASQSRLEAISAAHHSAERVVAEARKQLALLGEAKAKHDKQLVDERAEHEANLKSSRDGFEGECRTRRQELVDREIAIRNREGELTAALAKCEELRRDLERRVDLVRQASAPT